MPQADPATSAVLDREAALFRVGGDLDLLREIAALFAEECPSVIQELRAALAKGDAPAIGRAAHGLKGSAANFGAGIAVELAVRIEQEALAGRLDQAGPLVEALERALSTLLAELQKI
jgi:HPt (histidine-containing phosphotransfer) domain-containing protein